MGIDITVSRTDDKYSTIYTNLKENERLLDRLLITTGKWAITLLHKTTSQKIYYRGHFILYTTVDNTRFL